MKANAPEKLYFNQHTAQYNHERRNDDDIEYTRTDAFIQKARVEFCKAVCNGKPPRSTCTSLGTCKQYDEFIKAIKKV